MELVYQNGYGATFKVSNLPNPKCSIQLVVDSIGLFMSESDLSELLEIIKESKDPCYCDECKGEKCRKLWCSSPNYDFGLILDKENSSGLEDLIKGTQFLLHMNETLEEFRLRPNKE